MSSETSPVIQCASYDDLPNLRVLSDNGIDYAYRDTSPPATDVPLVLLQRFRGNLDNWDPALIDKLAASRHSVLVSKLLSATTGHLWHIPTRTPSDAM
jgi:hypothetical protein